jgi:hypothetical protein
MARGNRLRNNFTARAPWREERIFTERRELKKEFAPEGRDGEERAEERFYRKGAMARGERKICH